jgi:outer membrane protein assembly factor BamB
MRRIQLLSRAGIAICALIYVGTAPAQVSPRLVVEPHRDVTQALVEAQQSIERKQYHSAVQLLQGVLERSEDNFVEDDFRDERGGRGGIRKEVNRLLMSLPAEGQAAYELEYGATARQLLTTALAEDDFRGVADVGRRFTASAAGYDALTFLAAQASDGNRPLEAALLLEPLRNHPRRTPQFSWLRAVYWSRAGRLGWAMSALKEFKRASPTGKVRLGGREISLPADEEETIKLLKSLAPTQDAHADEVATWSMVGGGSSRNSAASPASPVGGPVWRVSTLEHLTLDGRPEEDRRYRTKFQESLDRVRQTLFEENRSMIPAAQPLVIGDIVVYRTLADVTAVSLKTGELLWRSSVVDESLIRLLNARSAESQARLARSISLHAATLEGHLERRTYRDNAAGTLSSDGQTVFALEELDGNSHVTSNVFGASISRPANKLVAYDLAGGRLLWEVGGPRGTKPAELSAMYFLGPPLPIHDRLYVIAEGQGVLQLMVLVQAPDRLSVQIDWSQTLIATDPPLTGHPLRRLSGLSPSLSDGVIVCPTSSGAVVGIDLARQVLLWGFQYQSSVRPESQSAPPTFDRMMQQEFQLEESDKSSRWMDSTPLIADGKVIITPRDSDRLYCLDLIDGHEHWQMSREDWMYVACVIDGRVVLVGREGLGAVQLADGTAIDSLAEIQLEPTGRGVRVGSLYCVPTATGEIATIDLRSGHLLARSKLAGNVVPGNLVAGTGAIVSQSAGELIGFAPMEAIEQQIARLTMDPMDAQGLALRGELRLHQGEQVAGLADLRESLKRKPDPHVKLVLATALLAGLRSDPTLVRERVAELETLTDDPQQKNEFLSLYSQSLESMGDRRGAFTQLIRLADTAQYLDSLNNVEAGYSVRADRFVRGRMLEMYRSAKPEERKDLDQAIEQLIRANSAALGQVDHLERFLKFFTGQHSAEAALLREVVDDANPLRRELLKPFLRSGDTAVAAQATALLCRELVKDSEWVSALPLVRRLNSEFADLMCLEGKTGRSLAGEWSLQGDLPQLLKPTSVWPEGAIDVRRNQRDATTQRASIPGDVISRTGSLLEGWSFETDVGGMLLLARDASGVVRWKLPLPSEGEFSDSDMRNVPVSCQIQIRNNWIVVSRLAYFVVIDASANPAPRIVWQQLLKPPGVSMAELMQQQLRARGFRNGRFTSRTSGILGRVVGLTGETVIFTSGSKLLAHELETGRMAWSRQEASFADIEAAADDRTLAVLTQGRSGGNMILLRTLDGSVISRKAPQLGSPIWTRGSRQLVRRSIGGKTLFELRDLEANEAVWNHECVDDTQVVVVDNEDVAFLEASGALQMFRLADKQERYRAELPLKGGTPEKNLLLVQRSADQDIIMGGESYRHRVGQFLPFEGVNPQPVAAFDGFVCAVSRTNGKVLWTTPVEKVAFDKTQPSSLPVLVLASRQLDGRNAGNPFLQRFRMVADVIDKRTGLKIYSSDESAPQLAPSLEPDSENRRIVVNFQDWQLDLKFPESKVSPAK